MDNRGLKAILFGIQLVLIGGLLMYGLGPVIAFYGAQRSQMSGGTAAPFVYLGPLPGLIVVLIGGAIGFRGYRRDD